MFGDGSLTLREFAMKEPLPLAKIQEAVLDFLRHRDDAALFGAQAVNAYVDEPRMTQVVDILSTRAAALAEELRKLPGAGSPWSVSSRWAVRSRPCRGSCR